MEIDDYVAIEREARENGATRLSGFPAADALAARAAARDNLDHGPAWCAQDAHSGRVLAVAGIYETVPGAQGYGWAILSAAIGPSHLAITRFARRIIEASPLRLIEAYVRAENENACRWAQMIGFGTVAVRRRWGPHDETVLLVERVGSEGMV
jgi:hypothetical protein